MYPPICLGRYGLSKLSNASVRGYLQQLFALKSRCKNQQLLQRSIMLTMQEMQLRMVITLHCNVIYRKKIAERLYQLHLIDLQEMERQMKVKEV